MTILVDTGVLYADHDTRATRHETASAALERVYNGEYGQPFVNDYIFDETLTLTKKRTRSSKAAIAIGRRIRGIDPYVDTYDVLRVNNDVFSDAIEIFEKLVDQSVSFTDATIIAHCEKHSIDSVMSFDSDFDGLVSRVDPDHVS